MATRRWPPSQDQVIEAFVRWLNADRRAAYEIIERPDTRERALPAIDYILGDPRKHYEAAVEVSSVWRSEDAGKEDAYIAKWFESARRRVTGRVPGVFYLTLPIRVPQGANPEHFGDALVDMINRNHAAIVEAGKQGKTVAFTVAGIDIWIFQLPIKATGSDIDYARSRPDMNNFPTRVRACLDEKAPKLRPYSDSGVETWIVIYNTLGIAMSPFEAERIVIEECGRPHEHVAHIVLVVGNPPEDAWVQVVR